MKPGTGPAPRTGDLDHILADARRGHRRRLVIGALVCLLLAGVGAWLYHGREKSAGPRIEYVAAGITQGDLTVTVTATGTLEPLTQVDVGTELSGTVEEVLVDFNEPVTQGQVLARLDTDRLEALAVQARGSLASAQGALREAEATMVEARLKAERCAKLAARQMCAVDELDALRAAEARAVAAVDRARAQVAVARATLEERETDLGKAVIRAPIDGIVLKRLIEPGQTVAAMMETPILFTLAENLTQMELRVAVDEADVGVVAAGQRASFSVDAYPERTFAAEAVQVRYAPETLEGVVTYATVLTVDNADLALRPGMTATAEIVVEEVRDALLVPNAALRFTPPPATAERDERGLLGRLFMRWPRSAPPPRAEEAPGGRRTLWVLERNVPRPVEVTAGATDQQQTVVSGPDLRPGMRVAVDYVLPAQ
jgi:HlyD family secretion protein